MAMAYSGTPPYTYDWKYITGVPLGVSGASVSGLCAGQQYVVTITDAVGATLNDTTVIIEYTASSIAGSILTSADSGNGEGTASVTVSGTPPYLYLWGDPSAQTTATATNLSSGVYSVTVTDAQACQYLDSGTVGLFISIGAGLAVEDVFTVYPNPSSGKLHFVLKNSDGIASLNVYNTLGQRLMSHEQVSVHSLDLSHLESGLYFLRIKLTSGVSLNTPILLNTE